MRIFNLNVSRELNSAYNYSLAGQTQTLARETKFRLLILKSVPVILNNHGGLCTIEITFRHPLPSTSLEPRQVWRKLYRW